MSDKEPRTPIDNDLDPDGMDSENEGDELEAGGGDPIGSDDDDGVEPDGVRENPARPAGPGPDNGRV